MASPNTQPNGFVALDTHKRYVVPGAVDAQQNIVMQPHRVYFDQFDAWMDRNLQPTDAVVVEASTNAWHLYDQLQPRVASVTVAHPLLVQLITKTRVKTDPRDTIKLARLLAAGFIPAVWVPPQAVRDLRALVGHRCNLIRQRSAARNRLQSLLQSHNVVPPEGDVFSRCRQEWWEALDLTVAERLLAGQQLALLDSLKPLIADVEAELLRQSTIEPWAQQAPCLLQLVGIGPVTAMVLLAAIGDITRFPSPKELVSYGGLGNSVYLSGQVQRTGRITKQGRKEIRWAMVEAAWVAVAKDPHWKAEFQRLERRIGAGKAIVAIARKMLVVVWHVLSRQAGDRRADVEFVARKLMNWGTQAGVARKRHISRTAFVREQLETLGLGPDLERFIFNKKVVELPPSNIQRFEAPHPGQSSSEPRVSKSLIQYPRWFAVQRQGGWLRLLLGVAPPSRRRLTK